MSGLLESLVERALGRAETLRPAPRARFEGERGALDFDADDHFDEESEEGAAERRDGPDEALQKVGPLEEPGNRSGPQASTVEPLLPRAQAPAGTPEDAAAPPQRETANAELKSPKPVLLDRSAPEAGPETPPSRVEKTRETHKETRVERQTRVREVELLPEAREPVEPRSPIAAAFEKAQATPSDTKAPSVTLSIGRIEVRPTAQPPQAAARAASPAPTVRRTPSAKPRQSLGEYLAKRRS